MNVVKNNIFQICILFFVTIFFSNIHFAQTPVIIDTLAYTQISNFTDITVTSRIRTSSDGSKIIFTGNTKIVYTMFSDGSELRQIFDFSTFRDGCPCIDLYIDISGDGSTIMWTDGFKEIFTANFDGSNMIEIATLLPRDPPFGDVEPDIPFAPKLTYDGSKVFFFNIAGWVDVAGLYSIGADGSGLTKLFSYSDLSQNIFGMDGSEYNFRTAFSTYFDISDDGTKGVFATYNFDIVHGHTIIFNNSALSLVRNYAPLFGLHTTGIGHLSISRDGSRIAVPFPEDNWIEKIHVMDFNGANQIELPFTFNTRSTFQLDSTGSNMIATLHWAEFGGGSEVPISYIDIDSLRILDLTLLEGNPNFVLRFARSPVINYNAKTILFMNGKVHGDSLEQIWKLDINPDSLINHPVISNVNFSPNYVPYLLENSTTFKASVVPGKTNIQYVNWDTFWDGSSVNRGLKTFDTSENLVDDGTKGDVGIGDGIYTREGIFADLLKQTASLTIRLHADAGKYITSIDVAPFFIWDSTATSVQESKELINRFELFENYPNPFNPSTKIKYSIPFKSNISLRVFDVLGNEVLSLVDKEQVQGDYEVEIDGSVLTSGIYFYRLQTNGFTKTKKMIVLK